MDQKNMMDRIRHSAEHIEVPEQLTPQKVEEQLRKSDSQKSTRRRKIMIRWMEAAAVLALVAVGGTQIGTQKQPGYTTEARLQEDQEMLAESVTESEQISGADAKDTMAKDLGTILVGKNAVEEGLIAHVGNLQDAIESLEKKVEEKKEDSKW